MTEDDTNPSEKIGSIFSIVDETQKKLESEIKSLGKSIDSQSQSTNNRNKEIFDLNLKKLLSTIDNLKEQLDELLNQGQSFTSEELLGLRESLDGQLDSLRGYANQLVEDEELRLVTVLETSLTNVTDITKVKSNELNEIIHKVVDIAENSSVSPIKIIQEVNQEANAELGDLLKIEKEKLASNIIKLQNEFRDDIANQIEKVFMGVTLTKESINGIIKDTLSRLEDNLNRLTEGIDENFSNEIGVAQDVIHNYEGKLMDTIEKTQKTYDKLMESILSNHSKKTLESIEKLGEQLNLHKEKIVAEISNLTKEQEELITHTINQLEEQIVDSKAAVIESHGVLKDDLEKLLTSNSDTVKQAIEKMHNNNEDSYNSLLKKLSTISSDQKNATTEDITDTRKELEQSIDQFRKNANQLINTAQQHLKEFESSIKQEKN
ncbi:MAG: hypothetical protein ACXAB7_07490 [Candidatus Kariarchaeaceae archaeon]|jgi:ABC-type transporter Mla subunit MlaD